MSEKILAAPGSWESNINTDFVVNGSPRISDLLMTSTGSYWLESIPSEKGRMAILRYHNGETTNILAEDFNVRSKVHEYGGGAFCVTETEIFFVNADDQEVYRFPIDQSEQPRKITDHPDSRFADLHWDAFSNCLIAIREQHSTQGEVKNTVVRICESGQVSALTEGDDFYSYPRISPSGKYICWISWQHPNMPWDESFLHVHERDTNKHLLSLGTEQAQSITQPTWGVDDTLYYVSDKDNWWNIFALSADDIRAKKTCVEKSIFSRNAEFATPQWVFSMRHLQAISENELLAAYTQNGEWHLGVIDQKTNTYTPIIENTAWIDSVNFHAGMIGIVESQTDTPTQISLIDYHSLEKDKLKRSSPHAQGQKLSEELSTPESIYLSSKNGEPVHAFFYPAFNSRYTCTEPTPLIVLCHGGPTGQTSSGLNYKIQYWTNRGFAVVDVNYRGSTGFGRKARSQLNGNWGQVDVDDVVSIVDGLIQQNKVDENKIIIKGSSAGGYSVLAALTFTNRFNAGVSLYGIGDLELLAKDTHKFEKYYLDSLVGPYPQERQKYIDRSPIHHTEKLNCPLLLFQGLEDKVVPPEQAQKIQEALKKKGLDVKLVEYSDEGHGFRNPENTKHMLETELAFYQRTFGLS